MSDKKPTDAETIDRLRRKYYGKCLELVYVLLPQAKRFTAVNEMMYVSQTIEGNPDYDPATALEQFGVMEKLMPRSKKGEAQHDIAQVKAFLALLVDESSQS